MGIPVPNAYLGLCDTSIYGKKCKAMKMKLLPDTLIKIVMILMTKLFIFACLYLMQYVHHHTVLACTIITTTAASICTASIRGKWKQFPLFVFFSSRKSEFVIFSQYFSSQVFFLFTEKIYMTVLFEWWASFHVSWRSSSWKHNIISLRHLCSFSAQQIPTMLQ